MTRLTKTFPHGLISTWDFGQLSDGRFAAKSKGGKRFVIGKDMRELDRVIHKFMYSYGYHKHSAKLIEQLSLPV